MKIATLQNNFDLSIKLDRECIAKIIAWWGPEFTMQWFDGRTFSHWADENEIPVDERSEIWKLFNPTTLKRFILHNIADPLKSLGAVKQNLETTLTTANIAEHLGWTEEEVDEVFTSGWRKRVATHNIADPLSALAKVKLHLETTLTTANIAEHLGWTEEEVDEAFTSGVRKFFAFANPTDPLSALAKVKLH